jgi:serine/threonine protein kinase
MQRIETLLADAGVSIDESVMRRMHRRYDIRVHTALLARSPQMARDVYDDAESLPSTETEVRLGDSGLKLNGPLLPGSALIVCFRGSVPHVLKIDSQREHSGALVRLRALLQELDVNQAPTIVSFEWIEDRHMLMPFFASTLEHIPSPLSAMVTSHLWQQLSDALRYLHSRGAAHMDVKPSNVFVATDGSFVLGDLGSVARFNERTMSTRAFIPDNLQVERSGRTTASEAMDWWMMAMTLFDKVVVDHTIGSGARELRTTEVVKILPDSPTMISSGVWKALSALLIRD